jgi:hypothetical protein
MYAIREIADVDNNIIKVQLPLDFPSKKAEIFIVPFDEIKIKSKTKKLNLPELISITKQNYASQIILEDRR